MKLLYLIILILLVIYIKCALTDKKENFQLGSYDPNLYPSEIERTP